MLDEVALPRTFDDLADQDFVGIDDTEGLLAAVAEQGLTLRIEQFRVHAASGNCMLQLIREGLGFSASCPWIRPGCSMTSSACCRTFRPGTFRARLVAHRELDYQPAHSHGVRPAGGGARAQAAGLQRRRLEVNASPTHQRRQRSATCSGSPHRSACERSRRLER
ncbi:MAG: hypothetical protein ACN6I7_04005 [bacterium]